MSRAIENLQAAQKQPLASRPKVGGFPYLAETLRQLSIATAWNAVRGVAIHRRFSLCLGLFT
jgi:uncharacterized protein YbcV (DUF1398 family)